MNETINTPAHVARAERLRHPLRLALALFVCGALLALAACTSRPAPLEDPPAVPTEAATFDTAAIESAMDAMLAAGAPAVLVEVRDGDEVWRHSVGVTTVTGAERPDPLAPVRIASVTKSMVGALLMQLVAEEELDLDEPIATYLPELRLGREAMPADEAAQNGAGDAAGDETPSGVDPDTIDDLVLEPAPTPTGPDWTAPGTESPAQTPPDGAVAGSDIVFDAAGEPIIDPTSIVTARMLAQHTAGLPDYIGTFPLDDIANLTSTLEHNYELDELIERVAAEPWTGTPGEVFSYSNTNYLVLSMLIEQITGDTIDEALADRIFDGGDLDATSLPNDHEMPEGAAHGYFAHEGVVVDVTAQSATLWSGAGGVVSTVGDVNSFYRGLMHGTYLHADELHEMLELNGEGYGIGIQGHLDPCGPGEPIYATPPATDEGDTDPSNTDPNDIDPVDADPAETLPSSSTPGATLDELVQIGEPGMTYGHLGSGLGYRILSFSSPDGLRQVTVSWTASPIDYAADPRLAPAEQALDAGLRATCPGPAPTA